MRFDQKTRLYADFILVHGQDNSEILGLVAVASHNIHCDKAQNFGIVPAILERLATMVSNSILSFIYAQTIVISSSY